MTKNGLETLYYEVLRGAESDLGELVPVRFIEVAKHRSELYYTWYQSTLKCGKYGKK